MKKTENDEHFGRILQTVTELVDKKSSVSEHRIMFKSVRNGNDAKVYKK